MAGEDMLKNLDTSVKQVYYRAATLMVLTVIRLAWGENVHSERWLYPEVTGGVGWDGLVTKISHAKCDKTSFYYTHHGCLAW